MNDAIRAGHAVPQRHGLTALILVLGALVALVVPAAPAAAAHETCSMNVYKPWAVHNADGNKVKARGAGEAFCARGTTAYLEITLQRHRWWGWEEVDSTFKQLNDRGRSGFVTATYWCNGDGRFTYRTMGELQIRVQGHGNSTPDWYHYTQLSPTNRFSC